MMAEVNFNEQESLKRLGQQYDEEGNEVTTQPNTASVSPKSDNGQGSVGYDYANDPLAKGWNPQTNLTPKGNVESNTTGKPLERPIDDASNYHSDQDAEWHQILYDRKTGNRYRVGSDGKRYLIDENGKDKDDTNPIITNIMNKNAMKNEGKADFQVRTMVAQKQYAKEQDEAAEKQKAIQAQWEPTRENIKASGLNAADYIRKAKEAGAKVDYQDVFLNFYGKDPSKSMAENEADEKKAKAKANMDAIGNALMHVGNFVGGMVGGQSVQLEDPVKFTARQQALKDKTTALRQAAWQNTYGMYKDKVTAERAQAAAELAARREARLDAEAAAERKRKEENDKRTAEYRKEDLEIKKQNQANQTKKTDAQITQGQQRTDAYTYGQHHKGTGGGSRGGGGSKDYTKTSVTTNSTTGETITKTETRTSGAKKQSTKKTIKGF